MNDNSPTILQCNFHECSDLLETLNVDINESFRRISTDYHEYRSKPYIFSKEKMEALIYNIYDQAKSPNLGLLLGSKIRYGFSSGDESYFYTQLSLTECLWSLARYLSDFFPEMVVEYFESQEVVGFKLIRCPYSKPNQAFYVDALAAMIHNFVSFLMGKELQPEYIAFNYQRPFQIDRYRKHFRCQLYFNSNQFEYAVRRESAETTIVTERNSMACAPQHSSIGKPFPLQLYSLSQVIRKLIESKSDETPSADYIARYLKVSGRTMRRRLSKFNSSFQKELDLFRRDLAFEYLSSGNRNITEIAFMLGFYDAPAFNKSFKRWSGLTPSEFRKRFYS